MTKDKPTYPDETAMQEGLQRLSDIELKLQSMTQRACIKVLGELIEHMRRSPLLKVETVAVHRLYGYEKCIGMIEAEIARRGIDPFEEPVEQAESDRLAANGALRPRFMHAPSGFTVHTGWNSASEPCLEIVVKSHDGLEDFDFAATIEPMEVLAGAMLMAIARLREKVPPPVEPASPSPRSH